MMVEILRNYKDIKKGVYELALNGREEVMIKLPITRESWRSVKVPVFLKQGKCGRRRLVKRIGNA